MKAYVEQEFAKLNSKNTLELEELHPGVREVYGDALKQLDDMDLVRAGLKSVSSADAHAETGPAPAGRGTRWWLSVDDDALVFVVGIYGHAGRAPHV